MLHISIYVTRLDMSKGRAGKENIKKITKLGKKSFGLTLPVEIIYRLG